MIPKVWIPSNRKHPARASGVTQTKKTPEQVSKNGEGTASLLGGGDEAAPTPTASPLPTVAPKARGSGRQPDSLATMVTKTATTALVGTIGREIMRGLLGGGRRR